ncbi:hypothetical protein SCHPADRAFT_899124 [Schizopora paradoxa]|uniref:Uncharacterized protein n=1 Tax=Schizopora paradoxa TaxID=27342 RepID=A0A0H2S4H0_9AGAM|nr:hypothetical protein SCHPADRAFT_899124 [Schizopora paradoxa]
MALWQEIKFLTYYGFAFSKDELEDLARRIERKHSRLRSKVYIEKTWKSDARASERQLKDKEWLICVKTARTSKEPGSQFLVEEELLKGVVEWLEGLEYSSDDQEGLKAAIPGIHFYEARCFLDSREGRRVVSS